MPRAKRDSQHNPRQLAYRRKVLHADEVTPFDSQIAGRICRALSSRTEILDAYLFGSQARGNTHSQSDVDIAVYLDSAIDLDRGFGIESEIATDLMGVLGRNDIDVVVLNRADPVLYHRVLRDGVRLIAREPHCTAARETYALSRYFDFLPQLEKIRTIADRRSARGEFGR